MNYFDTHRDLLEKAKEAIKDRGYWSPYPEHPKAYAENAAEEGNTAFGAGARKLNGDFLRGGRVVN